MAKSKFFRVAVEGATTDGRAITRSWLEEMAATYDRAKYGARIFIEHIRGYSPKSDFRAMGDVLALKTDTVQIDGQDRLALFAEIDPTDEMVALIKDRQKIYTSVEISPDFAGTGKAYLGGLGITDSPASIGTEVLTFAAAHPAASPFASRKAAPGNLFSVAELSEIELVDEPAASPTAALFANVRAALEKIGIKAKAHDGDFAAAGEALQGVVETLSTIADAQTAAAEKFAADAQALGARITAIETAATARDEAFTALRTELSTTPAGPARPAATGVGDVQLTDC